MSGKQPAMLGAVRGFYSKAIACELCGGFTHHYRAVIVGILGDWQKRKQGHESCVNKWKRDTCATLTFVLGVLLFLARTSGAEPPHVLHWIHPAPFEVHHYEYQEVGAQAWLELKSVLVHPDGSFYGFAFLDGFEGNVWVRAVSVVRTTVIVSEPSNDVPAPCTRSDANRDGVVGMADFAALKINYGKSRAAGTCE